LIFAETFKEELLCKTGTMSFMADKVFPSSYDRIVLTEYSPSGDYLLFSGGRCLFIFHTKDYSIYRFLLVDKKINSFCFNPHENMISSVFGEGEIIVWTFPECEIKAKRKEDFRISTIISHNSGNFLFCGGEKGEICIKKSGTLDTLCFLKGHKERINVLYFIEKDLFASGSSDGEVKIWKVKENNGMEIKEVLTLKGHSDEVYTIVSCNGMLVSGGEDGLINFWSLPDGRLKDCLKKDNGITSLLFDNKKNLLYYASSARYYGDFSDDLIEIYDLKEKRVVQSIKESFSGLPSTALKPDGMDFAGGGFNETVKIWRRLDNGVYSFHTILKKHTGILRFMKYVNQTSNLVASDSGGSLIFWDTSTGNIINKIDLTGSSGVKTVAFTSSSIFAALSLKCKFNFSDYHDKHIKLWNLPENREVCRFAGHRDEICALAFNQDGTLLASGGKDRTLRIWPVADKSAFPVITGENTGTIEALSFNITGKLLASGGTDGNIFIWDLEEKILSKKLKSHEGGVTCLEFSLIKEDKLLSGSYDGKVNIWSIEASDVMATIETGWSIRSIKLDPHEKFLVIVKNNGIIEIWDLEEIKLIKKLRFRDTSQWLASVRFDDEGNLEVAEYGNSLLGISRFKLS